MEGCNEVCLVEKSSFEQGFVVDKCPSARTFLTEKVIVPVGHCMRGGTKKGWLWLMDFEENGKEEVREVLKKLGLRCMKLKNFGASASFVIGTKWRGLGTEYCFDERSHCR